MPGIKGQFEKVWSVVMGPQEDISSCSAYSTSWFIRKSPPLWLKESCSFKGQLKSADYLMAEKDPAV